MMNVEATMATHQVEQGNHGGSNICLSCRLADSATSTWASLPTDLLNLIASRVLAGDLLDYVRFRAVCSWWCVATLSPHGRGVVDPCFHPRRWMMFPEGGGLYPGHPALLGYVRFFNISSGTFIRVRLPCFENHSVLDCPDGLLLLQHNKSSVIRLLHPFTGDVVLFPPLSSMFPELSKLGCSLTVFERLRIVFAAVSVNQHGTVTIMLALSSLSRVAYASTSDRQWTPTSWTVGNLSSACPFRGSLYLVNGGWGLNPSSILRIDPPDESDPSSWSMRLPQMVATCPAEQLSSPALVECNSELLLVGYINGQSQVVVLRVADLLRGVPAMPLTSIGDQTLFVGAWNMSVNSKSLPTVQGNSIAILSAIGGGRVGRGAIPQYDLGSGSWSQVFDGHFLDGPMPRPYSLVLHVATSCQRLFWNCGKILCFNLDEGREDKERSAEGSTSNSNQNLH